MCIWGYPIDLWKHRMELNWLVWNKSAHPYMAPITIQVDPDSCPECERRSPTQPYPPQWLSTDYLPWPTVHVTVQPALNSAKLWPLYLHPISQSQALLPLCITFKYLLWPPHLRTPLKKPQSLPTQHQPLWSVPLGILTWYFRRNMNSNKVRWSRVGHEAIRLLTWSQ